MKKSTLSVLLVAMMATSGFVAAQTSAPSTDAKAGTQGGSGPSAAEKAAPGSMPNSRAEVKSEATPMKSGTQGGAGPVTGAPVGSAGTTRADVKAGATPMKSGIQGGSGPSPDANMNTQNSGAKASTSAERKARRAERREKRKASRDSNMSNQGGTSPREGKSAN